MNSTKPYISKMTILFLIISLVVLTFYGCMINYDKNQTTNKEENNESIFSEPDITTVSITTSTIKEKTTKKPIIITIPVDMENRRTYYTDNHRIFVQTITVTDLESTKIDLSENIYPWIFDIEKNPEEYAIAAAILSEKVIKKTHDVDLNGSVPFNDVNFILNDFNMQSVSYTNSKVTIIDGVKYIKYTNEDVEKIKEYVKDYGLEVSYTSEQNNKVVASLKHFIQREGVYYCDYSNNHYDPKILKLGNLIIIAPTNNKSYIYESHYFYPKEELTEDITINDIKDWTKLGLVPFEKKELDDRYFLASEFISNGYSENKSGNYALASINLKSYTITRTKKSPSPTLENAVKEHNYSKYTDYVYITFEVTSDKYNLFVPGNKYRLLIADDYRYSFIHIENDFLKDKIEKENPEIHKLINIWNMTNSRKSKNFINTIFITERIHDIKLKTNTAGENTTAEEIKEYAKKYYGIENYEIIPFGVNNENNNYYGYLSNRYFSYDYLDYSKQIISGEEVVYLRLVYYYDINKIVKSDVIDYYVKFDGLEYYVEKIQVIEESEFEPFLINDSLLQ